MFISPKFELYCSHFTFTASPFSESTSKSETSCLRWLKWDLYLQTENKCDTTFSYIYTFYIYRRPTIFNRGRQNCASFHDFDWDGSLRYQIIFLKQAVFFIIISIYMLFFHCIYSCCKEKYQRTFSALATLFAVLKYFNILRKRIMYYLIPIPMILPA